MNDLVSRQALLDEFEKWQKTEDYSNDEWNLLVDVLNVIKSMPPVLQLSTNLAEVGTDCISRQAAIDYFVINVGFHDEDGYPIEDTDELRKIWTEYFDGIPSAEPKRGRWIKLDMHRGMADHKCTACEQECYVPTCMGEPMYAFCPNCGAKMEVEHEIN